MKRIVNYSLMLLILITVVCVTVLFAQDIAHNNIWDNVENIKAKWGKIKSKAKSNGGLKVLVENEVDIDYPNEDWGWLQTDGIKYEAYARVSAGWQWGTHGTYYIEAKADDDIDADGDDYENWAWERERAKDFSSWKKIHDNPGNFPTDANGNAKLLDDYNADDVRSELGKCDADGTIERIVPAAGAGGNANAKGAMAQTSGGCDSGGCDSGGCDSGGCDSGGCDSGGCDSGGCDDDPDDPDDDDDEYYKASASID